MDVSLLITSRDGGLPQRLERGFPAGVEEADGLLLTFWGRGHLAGPGRGLQAQGRPPANSQEESWASVIPCTGMCSPNSPNSLGLSWNPPQSSLHTERGLVGTVIATLSDLEQKAQPV